MSAMQGKKAFLILQMQRMGDLVLTFPLLLWLARLHPGHPLWVVAERLFFEQLTPLSPKVMYIPWEEVNAFVEGKYFEVVHNLSHRNEAAELAGRLRSEMILGYLEDPDAGSRYIRGCMSLYRASLTHNNRHNRFHWADMNALDLIPLAEIAKTVWPTPRRTENCRNVGLFLGASEQAKRPSPEFWAQLANEMLRRDLRPVLLGGPMEEDLGHEVAQKIERPVLNLCGEFKLKEFAAIGRTLALLVTPDTGPMHVGVWSGLLTLNLSMGPVNPWETGPYLPGHYVLQSSRSCSGCWGCGLDSPRCREDFHPGRVAMLCRLLASGDEERLSRLHLKPMRLWRTARDKHGLYHLEALTATPDIWARDLLGQFWKAWFGAEFGYWGRQAAIDQALALEQLAPRLARSMQRAAGDFSQRIGATGKLRRLIQETDLWAMSPPVLRPLTGYIHMFLQNEDFSLSSLHQSLAMIDGLKSLLLNSR